MFRWIVTVGNNTNPQVNTVCRGEDTMLESGFYMCPLALYGNVFGIWEKTPTSYPINFLEVMMYS